MVSEKVLVALIIAAILLSAVSLVITVTTVTTNPLPEVRNVEVNVPDQEPAQVGLVVNPQSSG
jgi:cell division protein FtsL